MADYGLAGVGLAIWRSRFLAEALSEDSNPRISCRFILSDGRPWERSSVDEYQGRRYSRHTRTIAGTRLVDREGKNHQHRTENKGETFTYSGRT